MTPSTSNDRLSDDAPRRICWKWFILAGVVLLAGIIGFVWWSLIPSPLTDEERQFVGWWKGSGGYKNRFKPASPIIVEAIEYRADRTIRRRKVDTRTGAVSYEMDPWKARWKVVDGQLITTYRFPNWMNEVRRGNYWSTGSTTYRITWDGPDRYLMDRVDLPPGVERPTFINTRWEPPSNP